MWGCDIYHTGAKEISLKSWTNVSGVLYNTRMTQNWFKYTYVCSTCDALIEITNKSNVYRPHICCGIEANWLSVVDATIQPTTTEEEKMETTTATFDSSSQTSMAEHYNNQANMIVKDTTSGELIYKSVSPYDVNCLFTDAHLHNKQIDRFSSQIQTVKGIIIEAYEDSGDQDSLREIAEALDIELTKTIEWSATMYVTGCAEVSLFDDFDLDSELMEQLQVSAWSGDIEVEDYHVEDVRER